MLTCHRSASVDDQIPHVGGLPEPTQYDYDAIMCVSDTGRIDGQPKNMRATEYIRTESEAAKQGRMIGIDPSCASTAKSWWSEMPSRAYGTCLIDWSNASGPHATFRLATGFAMCFKIATRTE
jgi:hypothetical protein